MLALTVSPLKTWEDFIPYGKRKFLRAKTIIFRQGEIEPGFYYVKKGIVKIFTMKPDINKRILDVVGPGMLIGEHTMDQLPCFSTAISHEDSILYHFTNKVYKELSRKNPEITLLFAQSLIHKKKLLLNNINATNASTDCQVARSLLYLMEIYQSSEINLTQQELSYYVGLTRITVHKILKKWASEGITAIRNRKIFIINKSALKRKAFS